MKALEILLPLGQSFPVGDHVDPDGLVRHITDALGVPKTVLNSESQIQQTREARAQQQAQMAERQSEQEDVYTAAQAAQAVRMVQK